jgi:ribosome modulation factor
MTEFTLVSTLADLDTLDETEMLEGYRDGLANEPEPGGNRSRSYWHGWRNGMADRGLRPVDEAQRDLAREYLARSRAQ